MTISKTIAITSLDLFIAKSCLWKRDLPWQFLAESSHVLEVSLEMGTFAKTSTSASVTGISFKLIGAISSLQSEFEWQVVGYDL